MLHDANLKVAVIHLEAEVLQWHQVYVKIQSKQGRTLSWTEYVIVLQARFGEEFFEDTILEMKNLHQEGSFSEY